MVAARKPRVAKKPARKPARSAPKAKPKAKAAKKARKAFGGYTISFSGRRETLEKVFGKRPIPPNEMNKKIWAFIKANDLSSKK